MVIPFTVGESTANVTHSAGDDALQLTIQQLQGTCNELADLSARQAERIRALEAEDTYNTSMISAAATKIDGLEQQLSEKEHSSEALVKQLNEMVEYAGKLRAALQWAMCKMDEGHYHLMLSGKDPYLIISLVETSSLPKAMQEE